MATTTIYREWLLARYGTIEAVDDAHDDLRVSLADFQAWSLAVCEEAGIPYEGWTADVLRCARQRLQTNEAERDLVRCLNDLHNDEKRRPALDEWLLRLTGWDWGAYGAAPGADPDSPDCGER